MAEYRGSLDTCEGTLRGHFDGLDRVIPTAPKKAMLPSGQGNSLPPLQHGLCTVGQAETAGHVRGTSQQSSSTLRQPQTLFQQPSNSLI